MPSEPSEPESTTQTAPTRRCWRCLQQFPCPPEDVATGPGEWWLCDPCHATLTPG